MFEGTNSCCVPPIVSSLKVHKNDTVCVVDDDVDFEFIIGVPSAQTTSDYMSAQIGNFQQGRTYTKL